MPERLATVKVPEGLSPAEARAILRVRVLSIAQDQYAEARNATQGLVKALFARPLAPAGDVADRERRNTLLIELMGVCEQEIAVAAAAGVAEDRDARARRASVSDEERSDG